MSSRVRATGRDVPAAVPASSATTSLKLPFSSSWDWTSRLRLAVLAATEAVARESVQAIRLMSPGSRQALTVVCHAVMSSAAFLYVD